MEPPPAHHRAAESHERFVDVVAFVETRPQATELVEQGQGLLHDVAEDAQAAAVRRVASRDQGGDGATRQLHSMRIGIVAPVAHHFLGLAQRRADLAADRWNRVDQRDQLRDVVAIGCREDRGQRNPAGIDDDVMF